jgi:hypothetical protein
MKKGQVIHLVGNRCRPDVEDKLNRWMDEIHIPMLMKFRGLKSATRFKRLYPGDEYPLYITQFVFESKEAFEAYEKSPELAVAMEETKQFWKPGERERTWRVQYQVISKHG